MSDNKISEMIKASLDGIRELTDINTVVGQAITTQNGVTVIPISKITLGFANGGIDLSSQKSSDNKKMGLGGGTGISITPLAFLVVGKEAEVNLIPLSTSDGGVSKAISIIEQAPEIIGRIRSSLS